MSEIVVLDGELSLEISMDGECGTYMQVGNTPVIESLEVTENGTYAVGSGVDGFSPVTVNIPIPEPSIESLTVTENGTYTASGDGYNPVTVNVPAYVPVTETLTATANGTYTLDEGVDGFSSVTVTVPQVVATGTFTLESTTVEYNIPHGLGVTPSFFLVECGATSGATRKFCIRDTNFDVQFGIYGSNASAGTKNDIRSLSTAYAYADETYIRIYTTGTPWSSGSYRWLAMA